MIFEKTIQFEPTSLKRHRHRLAGGTYDPSKKEKDEFIQKGYVCIGALREIGCVFSEWPEHEYCELWGKK